jgi:peroxiredoxin
MNQLAKDLASIQENMKANSPVEVWNMIEQSIKDVQAGGIAAGLSAGDKAPDFTLVNAVGEKVNLYDELAKGPVVLTFYRGSWCPYCSRQLRSFQEALPDIQDIGAQFIAVSPQTPDHSLTQKEKQELDFQVLSDAKGLVSAKYNILFDVPPYLKEIYLSMGLDLEGFHGGSYWMLPVPATFMIDETATVRFADVNPNFMDRLDPEVIVDRLRDL